MRMWRYSIVAVAVLALSACGGQSNDNGKSSTMPGMTLSVVERDEAGDVVMEANVEIATDGSWQRTGSQTGSGSLTAEQVDRIDQLVHASDFPRDPENEMICTTEIPAYNWSLTTGDDSVSNSNGGCVSSDSAGEIVKIIKDAAKVGPTLSTKD